MFLHPTKCEGTTYGKKELLKISDENQEIEIS